MAKLQKAQNNMRKTMKEAFESIIPSQSVIKVNERKQKISFREWVWNYPENIGKLFKQSAPLSFIIFFSIIGFGIFSFLTSSSFANMITEEKGGVFVEGSMGAISSFNPLFTSQSSVDADIRALVFEKFIYISKDGKPLGGIAQKWDISQNGKVYEFTISKSHIWQDGEPLTIDDVLYTFEISKELASKYDYDTIGSSLIDVRIEKVGEDKIRFTLPEVNATFFEAVSVYIVPEHKFEGVNTRDIPFNSFTRYPLGSGPYEVYRSEPNVVYLQASDYYPNKPKIETFIYRLYSTYDGLEAAFRNGILDAIGVTDEYSIEYVNEYSAFKQYSVVLTPRLRMIFFNTRIDKLKDKNIRVALNYLTDKNLLLEKANISGETVYGPIAKSSWAYSENNVIKYEYNQQKAAEILTSLGYTKSQESGYFETPDKKVLSFTLSYYDSDLNKRIADSLKELWKNEGIVLNLEPLPYIQLTQEIVATRDFELLMYEVETTTDPDQYNLWHSLKVNYPDLNLSGYSYERVDIYLEQARQTIDTAKRISSYALFQKYLTQDAPVIFLYHPKYVYVVREGIDIGDISDILYPYQRFKNIADWKM